MWIPWLLGLCKAWLIHAAPAMPPQCWAITICVFIILLMAALIDACLGVVPDILIAVGLVITAIAQFYFGDWFMAGEHLLQGLAAGVLIWSINDIWYRVFKHDALGMGDAKWTMVAVTCFGIIPSVIAWGAGAVFAILFMLGMWMAQQKMARVHFAPFLFIGLCVGIHWENILLMIPVK